MNTKKGNAEIAFFSYIILIYFLMPKDLMMAR